jgi:hypothetical protein
MYIYTYIYTYILCVSEGGERTLFVCIYPCERSRAMYHNIGVEAHIYVYVCVMYHNSSTLKESRAMYHNTYIYIYMYAYMFIHVYMPA